MPIATANKQWGSIAVLCCSYSAVPPVSIFFPSLFLLLFLSTVVFVVVGGGTVLLTA